MHSWVDEQRPCTSGELATFYQGRRVLVVGADGFLGINCALELCSLGAQVSIFSRRPSPRMHGYGVRVCRGDLRELKVVRRAIADQQIVFDFAGSFGAVESEHQREKCLCEEYLPKVRLIRACAELRTRPLFVFCSSRLVYGVPLYLPVDELHPLRPQSAYALQKLATERCLRRFARSHGLRYCILRLSSTYGPLGRPEKDCGILNRFIRTASEGRPMRVFGDGDQRRDFIYVADVIASTLAAAASEQCENEIFNVGGREWIRIGDAARLISALAGRTPVEYVAWPEDARRLETGDYRSDLRKLDCRVKLPPAMSFGEGFARTLMELRCASGLRRAGLLISARLP